MSVLESLRKRARLLSVGLGSVIVLLVAMRWSSGQPLVQPSGDFGILIGAGLVTLYYVITDARASKAGPNKDRARELH